MPSFLYTRTQAEQAVHGASLSTSVVPLPRCSSSECDVVSTVIYYFLRDVFYAVDADGDGYVTAHETLSLFPHFTQCLEQELRAHQCFVGSGRGTTPANTVMPVMRSGVYATWLACPSLSDLSGEDDFGQPLHFLDFISLWSSPVGTYVTQRLGDEWTQERPDGSAAPTGGEEKTDSGVKGSHGKSSREIQMYKQIVQLLWFAESELTSSTSLFLHAPPPLPPPPAPQLLLTDAQVSAIGKTFDVMDSQGSGVLEAPDIATALKALLNSAPKTSGRGQHRRGRPLSDGGSEAAGETETRAERMENLARNSRATQWSELVLLAKKMAWRAIKGTTNGASLSSELPLPPSMASSLLTWPTFIRSFQCATGAFPAALIAWGTAASHSSSGSMRVYPDQHFVREMRREQTLKGRDSSTDQSESRQLALSPHWVSPLECAFLQHILVCYVEHLTNDSDSAISGGLTKPAFDRAGTSTQRGSDLPDSRSRRREPQLRFTAPEEEADVGPKGVMHHAAQLPRRWPAAAARGLALLNMDVFVTQLRQDIASHLFFVPTTIVLQEVAEHLVRSVCQLAISTSMVTLDSIGLPPQSSPLDFVHNRAPYKNEPFLDEVDGDDVLDVSRLLCVLGADPRRLGLDVLLSYEIRLRAALQATQQLPRFLVRWLVELISEVYLEPTSEGGQTQWDVGGMDNLMRLRRSIFKFSEHCSSFPLSAHQSTIAISTVAELARLITGASNYRRGQLSLVDCMTALASRVLAVPLSLKWKSCIVEQQDDPHQMWLLRLWKQSHGWLRFACRRLRSDECREAVLAMQLHWADSVRRFVDVVTPIPSLFTELEQIQRDHVSVCRQEPIVAAHVTALLLLQFIEKCGGTVALSDTEGAVVNVSEAMISEWQREMSEDTRPLLMSLQALQRAPLSVADAYLWAMYAAQSVGPMLGPTRHQVTMALCQLPILQTGAERQNSGAMAAVLVDASGMLFSLMRAFNAGCTWLEEGEKLRLANVLLGCCPSFMYPADSSEATGAEQFLSLNITALLRCWLDAFPLLLPVTHLSICCPMKEVGSIYFALKRLAAAEQQQQRSRSNTPGDPLDTSINSHNGITHNGLQSILGNCGLATALFAVAPPSSVDPLSSGLCDFQRVLWPMTLSQTGIRFSLKKMFALHHPHLPSSGVATQNCRKQWQTPLIAMALPARLQHAIAQLFTQLDQRQCGYLTGSELLAAATPSHEGQERTTALLPSPLRSGWAAFISALAISHLTCATSAASDAVGNTQGLGGGPHKWCSSSSRDHSSSSASSACSAPLQPPSLGQGRVLNEPDDKGQYSLGDLLAKVGELRANVQSQLLLLEERPNNGADPSTRTHHKDMSMARQMLHWMSDYIELLCKCFTAIPCPAPLR